jgi:hypothetical protein
MKALGWALGALFCMLANAAIAEERVFGRYEVHYSVFASDFLQPPIAQANGVVRAADRAVLTVAVRLRDGSGGSSTVAATLTGSRSDLVHRKELVFQEIREDGAVYYITDFPFLNGETHQLSVDIRPDGDSATLSLRFPTTLYID